MISMPMGAMYIKKKQELHQRSFFAQVVRKEYIVNDPFTIFFQIEVSS
jgi:hypothetical protein